MDTRVHNKKKTANDKRERARPYPVRQSGGLPLKLNKRRRVVQQTTVIIMMILLPLLLSLNLDIIYCKDKKGLGE